MSFLELDGIHTGFIAENRPRALAAGVDPYEYDRVTAGIGHIREWPDAFIAAGSARVELGLSGSAASRASADRAAALLFHFATVLPDTDEERRTRATTAAASALARALPSAVAVVDEHATEGFRGYLRFPNNVVRESGPVVILVPGMNSSAVEFVGVTEVLLRRGLAVLAIDGPGQGACPGRWQPEFERVVGRAIDAVPGATSVGVWGMSMGGWLAARAAAYEPRVRALVAVSGPGELRWPELVPYVTDTFRRRAGGEEAGKAFAAGVDGAGPASELEVPALVVEGGKDAIPGVGNLADLAGKAPRGELVVIPEGNHLVEQHRHLWLPQAADWVAEELGATQTS